MPTPRPPIPTADSHDADAILGAFLELHATRLHGFALLVALGDRRAAARATADALAAAVDRADELRHPERAAAWLRARVVRGLARRDRQAPLAERRAALLELGVGDAVLGALTRLAPIERAALVASTVERLDPRDVATIVNRGEGRLESLLRRARARYLDAFAADAPPDLPDGPIGGRVREVAARTMA